jgi:hypothetical protein
MNVDCRSLTILLSVAAGTCLAQQTSDFAGSWVLHSNGQAIFQIVLTAEKGGITGLWTRPKHWTIDQDGDVTTITPDQVTLPIRTKALDGGRFELTADDDHFVMTLQGHDEASLEIADMPYMRPWRLDRSPDGSKVTIATGLPEQNYPQEIRALRQQLHSMVAEDQDARLAFNQAKWEAVDTKNRPEVLRIFERYGWVTNSLAGKDAAHDFWLLVQHQTPEIQQRLLPALEKAAKGGHVSMTDYAYLYDRVQMSLDKPQHWGNAVKCVNGKPVLYAVDDLSGLDARRKELFLMPVREYMQLDYMVKSCALAGR